MLAYRFLHLFKFLGVALYAGGLIASRLATTPEERRRAVHAIASPALLVIWASGYFLAAMIDVPVTELWIAAGFVSSFFMHLALVRSVSRPPKRSDHAVVVPFVVILALMVFRPTWHR